MPSILQYRRPYLTLLWVFLSLGCFESSDAQPLRHRIPEGYLARFDDVKIKQVNYKEERWARGEAKVLNAHPFKLKFDLAAPKGTVWLDNGNETRDFSLGELRLRGEQHQAHFLKTSVIGLGAGKWLRLNKASLEHDTLKLMTQKEAWMISPNTWLSAPLGLTADVNKGEVEAFGPVRLEAFSNSAFGPSTSKKP